LVRKIFQAFAMVAVIIGAALLVLALITQAGVLLVQRAHPVRGAIVEVSGASLHIVELGPRDAADPPIVMLHGASSNLEAMRQPLGEALAKNLRVILIDRPGHGWSTRARLDASTPEIQGRMIAEALAKLGVTRAIFVVHSWAGALGARMALDYPQAVAGLVMLAPVAYPWPGGVGWYNRLVAMPVVGPLLAYTITLPLGYFLAEPGARNVFLPQAMPEDYVNSTATHLLLRPHEFLANARDLVTLKEAVAAQAPRYGEIRMPVTIIAGDVDKTVSTNIHSRPFARHGSHDPERGARSRHVGDRGDGRAGQAEIRRGGQVTKPRRSAKLPRGFVDFLIKTAACCRLSEASGNGRAAWALHPFVWIRLTTTPICGSSGSSASRSRASSSFMRCSAFACFWKAARLRRRTGS
jgi:pimeloyl-ACP methyl ester carboxylesterase